MQPEVRAVEVLPGYSLALKFHDGTSGEVDLTPLLFEHEDGVFAELRDPRRFAEVAINPEWGHLEWPNGADVDPYLLYDQAHGRLTG